MSAHLDDAELLARLVAFDTTSANSNLPLVEFLADYLERPGVRVRESGYGKPAKVNLLVEIGPSIDPTERSGLLLSGHLDVVPAGEGWESDPFALKQRRPPDGALVRRVFVTIAANLALKSSPSGCVGRSPCSSPATRRSHGAHCSVGGGACRCRHGGRPTSLRVVRMLGPRSCVTVRGRPARPRPAVLRAAPSRARVMRLSWLRDEPRPSVRSRALPEALDPEHRPDSRRLGNQRRARALRHRSRPAPAAGHELRAIVERCEAVAAAGEDCELSVLGDSPPMLCPEGAAVRHRLRALVGHDEDLGASFASDAGPLQALGQESVLFGPGSIAVAHQPNEFVTKQELVGARGVLRELVRDLCEAPS
jgi:acetylornithine deacetylase